MKKYFLSSFILTILLSGVVYADTSSTNTNKIGEIRQKITDVKQQAAEQRNEIKAKIASTTAELKVLKQELKDAIEIKIGKKLDLQKIKVARPFEQAIQNLKDLVLRVESRISKMESNNIDTSSAKTLLETAKTNMALAETELTNLENLLAQNIPTATSTNQNNLRKTILQKIKTESDKTKKLIKKAHASIIDVINSLKPGLMKEKNATSSKEASTSTAPQQTINNK